MSAALREEERQRRVAAEAVSALRFDEGYPTHECAVNAFGIAQRIVELARPLFGLTDDGEVIFLADRSVSGDVFEAVLAREGLAAVISYMTNYESFMAAGTHADGSTLVGWPLSPPSGPSGWTAAGERIHPVRSEEDAWAVYMTALRAQTHSGHFLDDLRDCLHSEIRLELDPHYQEMAKRFERFV